MIEFRTAIVIYFYLMVLANYFAYKLMKSEASIDYKERKEFLEAVMKHFVEFYTKMTLEETKNVKEKID